MFFHRAIVLYCVCCLDAWNCYNLRMELTELCAEFAAHQAFAQSLSIGSIASSTLGATRAPSQFISAFQAPNIS
jgi:hypothetical protein